MKRRLNTDEPYDQRGRLTTFAKSPSRGTGRSLLDRNIEKTLENRADGDRPIGRFIPGAGVRRRRARGRTTSGQEDTHAKELVRALPARLARPSAEPAFPPTWRP